mmetsp:Transcript_11131/g.25678  ORF Transcript_11131/g.25678 Transcript_11131/m.25678 type:complete len:312 (-) Transcript_11131:316-1251(-)
MSAPQNQNNATAQGTPESMPNNNASAFTPATDPVSQTDPDSTCEACHNPVNPTQYGPNTPSKRGTSSGVWSEVKRLKGTLNNADGDATHICIVRLACDPNAPQAPPQYCNALLKMHRSKAKAGTPGSWLTTKGIDHLREAHPIESRLGRMYAERAKEKETAIINQQLAYGMAGPDGKSKVGSTFTLTKKERSLSAQAQWFTYSTMQISKSEFDSPWFKNMLQEVGDGEKTAILSKEMLSRNVRAEFEVFLIFLKLIISSCLSISMGNPFAMGLHDGGTLANKKKFQALALQFIAPNWKKNLCVTVALKQSG